MAAAQTWAYHVPLLLHLCQQTHTEGQVGFIDAPLVYVCKDVHLLFVHWPGLFLKPVQVLVFL